MFTVWSGPCQVGGLRYSSTTCCASARPATASEAAGPALGAAPVLAGSSSLQPAASRAMVARTTPTLRCADLRDMYLLQVGEVIQARRGIRPWPARWLSVTAATREPP